MTQETVLQALREYNGSVNFLKSLASQLAERGSLSEKQIAVAERILNEQQSNAGAREHAAAVNFAKIPQWLAETAARGVQFPKFHFIADDTELVLRFKGERTQRPGTVDVVSRSKTWNDRFAAEMPDWYGRIELDGSLTMSGRMTLGIETVLARIAEDPETVAVEYGRLTNRCSFCGRDLNNEVSVELGYGPVCAKKYGLGHNRKAVAAKREVTGTAPKFTNVKTGTFRQRMGLDD